MERVALTILITGLISGIYEAKAMRLLETKEAFDNFLNEAGSKLVVIDFYAQWCGLCKNIYPFFEQLAEEFTDVRFGEVNTDENLETAEEQGISAMPTFKFYRNGLEVDELTEANESKLRKKIKEQK